MTLNASTGFDRRRVKCTKAIVVYCEYKTHILKQLKVVPDFR